MITPPDPADLQVLATRITTLHEDVVEMKEAMKSLSDAITKLAIVEERQSRTADSMERAFKAIERVELRLAELEKKEPETSRAVAWMDKGVLVALGALIMYVLKKAGIG